MWCVPLCLSPVNDVLEAKIGLVLGLEGGGEDPALVVRGLSDCAGLVQMHALQT